MIGTLDVIVLDCADPRALARFYAELLGGEIVGFDEGWAEVALPFTEPRPILAFPAVAEYARPNGRA
ncbi:VOC family protein, partial [Curtobacterium sp. B18]|uniref:VOC family protein n=1 Tax=Curtobacterium sp. B18 TaxID=95614 RepID=UPI00273907BB